MAKLLTEEDVIIGNMFEMELKRQLAPVVEKFANDVTDIIQKSKTSPDNESQVPQIVLKQHIQIKTVEHLVVNLIGHIIGRSFPILLLKLNLADLNQALSQGVIDASARDKVGHLHVQLMSDVEFGKNTPKFTYTAFNAYARTSLAVLEDFISISDRMKDDDHANRPKPTNKII